MEHVGWLVFASGQRMFWPVEDLTEARTYCEDGVEPVKLMADRKELQRHEDAQGD